MSTISRLTGREVFDSRGNPTIEVDVLLSDGARGRAAVPSGASTGATEAVELRDGDPSRLGGLGILRALENVHGTIAPAISGMSAVDQQAVDARLIELDGTPNKARLGANAILGVSMGVARAAANSKGVPLYEHLAFTGGPTTLPVPMLNILNGGRHAEDSTDFQEFMVVPAGFDTFSRALRAGVETYHALRAMLRERGLATGLGDEGGFAPSLSSNREAVELIVAAIERAGYRAFDQCLIALDVAASELLEQDGRYALSRENTVVSREELAASYVELAKEFPIISIEDGMAEEDWGRLDRHDRQTGVHGPDRGRRPLHHQRLPHQKRHRAGGQQRRAHQAQPDRHRDRDAGGDQRYPRRGVGGGDQPQVRRDGRYDDRRPGRGDGCRSDQGRCARPRRADRQVQPSARNRAGAWRPGHLRWASRVRASASRPLTEVLAKQHQQDDEIRGVQRGGAPLPGV